VPDPAERIQALKQGEAQIATGLDPLGTRAQPGVRVDRSRGTTAYIIMFNAARGPLRDPRVRLAFNLGIDRQTIVAQVLNGAGYPLHGFISPHHVGSDPAGTAFPYDPGRARALLAAAGFKEGLEVTLDSPTSLPDEAVPLSEALAEQLRGIGVVVTPHYIEDRELYAHKVRLKEIHDMCVFDSSPLSTYRVLKEKIDSRFKGAWWQGYRHAGVENLIDRAQATVDPISRERVYRRCFRLLQEDPPWLYLYNHQILTGLSPALGTWRLPRHGVVDVFGLPAA
jgi:peptide/nickel transport system substrate-binding protein